MSEITHPAHPEAAQGTAFHALAIVSQIWLGLNSPVLMGQVPRTLPPHRGYAATLLLFTVPGDKAQIISQGGGHCLRRRGCQPRRGEPPLGHLERAKLGGPGDA